MFGTDTHPDTRSATDSMAPTDRTTVCHLVQDVSYGGVESLLADLVAETTRVFDHHICYLSDHDEGADRLREAGATVTRLDIPVDSPRSSFDPRSYLPIVRYLWGHDVEVLHTHYPLYVHVLGRVAGTVAGVDRAIGTYHNPRSDFHPVMQAVEVGTRPMMDATVGVSRQVEESFEVSSLRHRAAFAHDGPVYNGIPVESFAESVAAEDGQSVRAAHELSEETVVYLSVGRYDQQKRQVDLVDAIGRLGTGSEDVHLLLVGHGPLESRLRQRVEEYGLSDLVTVTGRVDSVEEYYAAGDVFVSASKYEGFGIVFVEAMAAGLPIVGTAVPGTTEVVADGEAGVLVPAERPTALARAMEQFEDPETRTRFGSRGERRARKLFDISTVADQYAALYRGQ